MKVAAPWNIMATYYNYHHNYQGHRIKNKEADTVTTAMEPQEPLLPDHRTAILLNIIVVKGQVWYNLGVFGVICVLLALQIS